MQNMKHIQKKNKGFAMGYVLIIIAMFTFLGAAMLMVSSSNMRTVTLPVRYVQYFYAAETGVQVIAQHVRAHATEIEDALDNSTDFNLAPLIGVFIPTDTVGTINNPDLRNALSLIDTDTIRVAIEDAIFEAVLPIDAGNPATNIPGEIILGIPGEPRFQPVVIGGQTFPSFMTPNIPAAVFMPEVAGSMEWTVQLCRIQPFSIIPTDPDDPPPAGTPLIDLIGDPQLRANFVLTVSAQGIGHVRSDGTTSGGVIVSGDIRLGVGPLNAPTMVDWQLTNVRER